jgi:tRNA (cytidine/uridine-2'-O-)-methyltransferase
MKDSAIQKANFKFHVVLYQPEIPPNTGNAGRLCVGTDSSLHLIGPLGFSIDDKQVRRAGLDYWKYVDLHEHENFEAWQSFFKKNHSDVPIFYISKFATKSIYQTQFPKECALVFGRETSGLPSFIHEQFSENLRSIPMFSEKLRSLNLSNAIAVTLYEAIRQNI